MRMRVRKDIVDLYPHARHQFIWGNPRMDVGHTQHGHTDPLPSITIPNKEITPTNRTSNEHLDHLTRHRLTTVTILPAFIDQAAPSRP